MDRPSIMRLAGYGLVVAGAAGTVAALLGPVTWRQGEAHGKPAGAVLLAIAVLAPALSAVRLAVSGLDPAPVPRVASAVVAAVGAAAGAALAVPPAVAESTMDGMAPGGPLAIAGCAATAAGWLLVAGTVRVPGRPGVRAIAASAAALALVAAMGYAAVRATAGRQVEHRVVPGGAPAAEALPSAVSSPRWRAEVTGTAVGVAGGRVLVRDPHGIRTVDAATGRPAWRYLRRDAVAAVGASADGATVAAWFPGAVVVGFNVRTGARRWQRRLGPAAPPERIIGADGLLLAVSNRPATVVALDATNGRIRWTWRPGNAGCGITDAVAAGAARLAVVLNCPDGYRVAGVSTVDAAVRWTWTPGESGPVAVTTAPGGVLVRAGGTAALLSAGTGTVGARHPAPPGLVGTAGLTAFYVGETTAAVDLSFGRPLWTSPAPGTGSVAVAATGRGVSAYVLVQPAAGGAARLLWLDLSGGAVLADRDLGGPATDVWLGPGAVLVANRTPARTTLTALA